MRIGTYVVASILLGALVAPTPAEAGGRRAAGHRRAPAPVPRHAVRRAPVAPRAAAPLPARARAIQAPPMHRAHAGRTLRSRAQPISSPSLGRTAAARAYHQRHTARRYPATSAAPRYRGAPSAAVGTRRGAQPAPLPTLGALPEAARHRHRAALDRLRGSGAGVPASLPAARTRAGTHRSGPAPAGTLPVLNRPRVRTGVTSRVDTGARLPRFGGVRPGDHARRHTLGRTPASLRALATRQRHAARNAVHHAGSHLHHRRIGSVRRHSHLRHRHLHRHRVVFVPLTYYVYPVPPSIGYQDDVYLVEPYCPPEAEYVEEYIEYEYGAPAPQPAPLPAPLPAPAAGPAEAAEAAPPAPGDFELGVEAFRAGDYAAAGGHFRETVTADPEDGEAWMALLFSSFMLERYDEAAEALARAAALDAFPRGYRFDARAIFADPAAFDAALARLDHENRIHPRNLDAWLLRAYFHVAAGEALEAQSTIQRVLLVRRTDPTAPVLHTALLPPVEDAEAPR